MIVIVVNIIIIIHQSSIDVDEDPEGTREGYPSWEIVILLLLTRLAWERLQIDTGLLLIITNMIDELSLGTTIDEIEWR